MFSEDQGFFFFGFDSRQCVWAFYPSTPCFEECWGWIVDLMLHHWRMWKRIIAFCSWRRIQWRIFFFFFLIWKSWIFSRNWKFWFVIFFFFRSNLRSMSPTSLVPRPFLNFFFFFCEIWRFVHYQKVKKMKIKME